jgi:hypothetical protein
MSTSQVSAEQRAARAATKDERARDEAQAMREYQAERLALIANAARLRAQRLAKEAGQRKPTKKPAKAVRGSAAAR